MKRRWSGLGLLLLAMAAGGGGASAQPPAGSDLRDQVGIEPRIGMPLPLDLEFRDEQGGRVPLRRFFGSRPVLLTPVYYRCPMLCGLELQGLVRTLRVMDLAPGRDFEIVTFSIDPREDAELARDKRASVLASYGRAQAGSGWHFLTGDEAAVTALCAALGFRAAYDSDTGQYAHAAGVMVATPQGRVSHYLYGVEFSPRDLRLALVESSEGRVGALSDRVLLYCYLYDATRGRYGLAILNLVRAGGVLTVLALFTGIGVQLRKERRSRVAARAGQPPSGVP